MPDALVLPDSTAARVDALPPARDLRFISRTFPLWVAAGLPVPLGLGVALTGSVVGGLTGLLWGGAVRVFLLHHVTFSINSLCHFFGRRPFATGDQSRNVAWLAPLVFGEAWHNNHHAFRARPARTGPLAARPRRLADRGAGALSSGMGRDPDQPHTTAGQTSSHRRRLSSAAGDYRQADDGGCRSHAVARSRTERLLDSLGPSR